jgi:hypothetical protein
VSHELRADVLAGRRARLDVHGGDGRGGELRAPGSHDRDHQPHDTDSRHLLMVVANPTTSPTTGCPVGFWASELFHPPYGVSGLVDVKLSDGSYLVDGRTVTGFANEALGV